MCSRLPKIRIVLKRNQTTRAHQLVESRLPLTRIRLPNHDIADSVVSHHRMTPFPSEQVRVHLLFVYRIRRIRQEGPVSFELFRHLERPSRLVKKPLHDLPAYFRILIHHRGYRPHVPSGKIRTKPRCGNTDQRLLSTKPGANRHDTDGLATVPTGSPTVSTPSTYRTRPVRRI